MPFILLCIVNSIFHFNLKENLINNIFNTKYLSSILILTIFINFKSKLNYIQMYFLFAFFNLKYSE